MVARFSVVPTLIATPAATVAVPLGALVALPSAIAMSLLLARPRTITVPWATITASPPMDALVCDSGTLTAIAAATATEPSLPGLPGVVVVLVVFLVTVSGGCATG